MMQWKIDYYYYIVAFSSIIFGSITSITTLFFSRNNDNIIDFFWQIWTISIGITILLIKRTKYSVRHIVGIIIVNFCILFIVVIIENSLHAGFLSLPVAFLITSYIILDTKSLGISVRGIVIWSLILISLGWLGFVLIVTDTESILGVFGFDTKIDETEERYDLATIQLLVLQIMVLPVLLLGIVVVYFVIASLKFRKFLSVITYRGWRKGIELAVNPDANWKKGIIAFVVVSICINFGLLYLSSTLSPFDLLGFIPGSNILKEIGIDPGKFQDPDFRISDYPDLLLFITITGPIILFIIRQIRLRDLKNNNEKYRGVRVLLIFLFFAGFSIFINEVVIDYVESEDNRTQKFNQIQELIVKSIDPTTGEPIDDLSRELTEEQLQEIKKEMNEIQESFDYERYGIEPDSEEAYERFALDREVLEKRYLTFFINGDDISKRSFVRGQIINLDISSYYTNKDVVLIQIINPEGKLEYTQYVRFANDDYAKMQYLIPKESIGGKYIIIADDQEKREYMSFEIFTGSQISFETLVRVYFTLALPYMGLSAIIATFLIERLLILKIKVFPILKYKTKDENKKLKKKINLIDKRLRKIEKILDNNRKKSR